MKHAYLIIAHNEYPVLEALLSMLDNELNDVFLHVDKRAGELFQQVSSFKMKRAGFYLLKNRMKVHWGDISQVKVEYLLFETALERGSYAYYHLMSGVDLPIKGQDVIHAFFSEHAGKEFVGFWQGAFHERDLDRKVLRYHLFTKRFKGGHIFLHSASSISRNIVLSLQKVSRYRRSRELEFKKGPNWVSVTQAFVEYLVEKKPFVLKRFRFTLCPDEIFLQTVLWNSPFRERIYSLEDADTGSRRLIDWERGKPYIWQNKDYEELMRSDMLFARKFSSADMEMIDKIRRRYSEYIER